ncbi:MAG: hypothetical protein ISS77_05515 [Phycisphaerae bacterium]|nr:hypothetical protein [Phycisphaerae bacterium]
MKTKELDKFEQKWSEISRIIEKGAGNKEHQKAEMLKQHGISSLAPEGYNLSEPELDTRFNDYLHTQREKNNHRLNFWLVIVTAGILVAMVLIAVFKD